MNIIVKVALLAVILIPALPLWVLGLLFEFLWSAFVSGRRAYPIIYDEFFK